MACEYLIECMFKQMHANKTSKVFKTLIEDYCDGPLYGHCERRKRFMLMLAEVPDSLLPTGQNAHLFERLG